MSSASDSGMVKTMGIVMGALLLFALICGVAARSLGEGDGNAGGTIMRNALMDRIQPVAGVRTSADELTKVSMATESASVADMTTEQLVNEGACAACHLAGVAGAPKVGDEAAWAVRRELGLDALVASVINGKGSMPARGGSTYSDEDIQRAVQHIALFETDDDAAAASEASDSAAASTESAAEPVAEMVAVVGQVPEGLTDSVRTTVDGLCTGCHLAGVAQAPKIGDVEAWQARADLGMAALTQAVINGKNAMPPRGGSTLTDEEIPLAIQYLMSK